jgi:hypothetical protein
MHVQAIIAALMASATALPIASVPAPVRAARREIRDSEHSINPRAVTLAQVIAGINTEITHMYNYEQQLPADIEALNLNWGSQATLTA